MSEFLKKLQSKLDKGEVDNSIVSKFKEINERANDILSNTSAEKLEELYVERGNNMKFPEVDPGTLLEQENEINKFEETEKFKTLLLRESSNILEMESNINDLVQELFQKVRSLKNKYSKPEDLSKIIEVKNLTEYQYLMKQIKFYDEQRNPVIESRVSKEISDSYRIYLKKDRD